MTANKISVEVRTPEGESAMLTVNTHESVQALKNEAITKLDLRPASGSQYFLFLNGKRLADQASLSEAGITDRAVLMLTVEPQVGARE